MNYVSMLITLISSALFVCFQQITFKKLNNKLHKLPLILSIVLMLVGGLGYVATAFSGGMIYFYIMSKCGFDGMIVTIAMLIVHKAYTNK